jgi:hypothetical protein
MLHNDVATGLRDPEAPLDGAALAALFVRCLVVGAIIATAAWLAIDFVFGSNSWLM